MDVDDGSKPVVKRPPVVLKFKPIDAESLAVSSLPKCIILFLIKLFNFEEFGN